ncbi:aspartate/glutamate racemase family protein [Sinorhizobium sp. BG8]|uniref:aspartate/glutamate racemase family protein n=1 Tax=Sinorhizobium sp. BG8 TaxID=2613773 RepID=UPI00193CBB4C|nr:aspartate/glutamate racemase family protein [Sinorhizobium sp. BG8]QRM55877.1 aspartate/glutamate racemase family protein [Sinorhizobium sp. BG8]
MKKIGLIGGMSFESSAVYYRQINEAVRDCRGSLHSAEVMLHSVDFQGIVDLQKAGAWEKAADRLAEVAVNLERAGADCVLICTNTMHLVAEHVQSAIGVPLIHVIDETARAIRAAGKRKALLLATRYTMEHGFYADRMAQNGVEITLPDAADRAIVHDVIFNELCAGQILEPSRKMLLSIIEKAKADGADSVILGCTEICLLLDPDQLPLPGFDSTALHAGAAVDFALGKREAEARAA